MRDIKKQLLSVHRAREDRAERAVVALHSKFVDAEKQVMRETRKLETWRVQAQDEENVLYASLLEQVVKPGYVDRVMQQINNLRQRTAVHERNVEQAHHDCDLAKKALHQGKIDRLAACRTRQKSTEIWQADQRMRALALERKADEELDEVGIQIYGRQ